eukprot:CAMPEP_0181196260 /NCGR_PEP_ID=MMETSP1096-20121128/15361_1 /TAXON_ID=156174 ORGANISM="Chrysochromulina ericina, Strain CCMP281" /NCGR_SAMPLE_ID=MMETSP1096 /ASSEMBLY_ACC=CAM_ASM_000453 /LENGTH=44 /DNA_ID= /DNA_START= /DNA_END= /DNA_ORIENTATION=
MNVVVNTPSGPSVMWAFDHLRPEHSGCWIDAEKYHGEVVEEAYW